MAKSGDSRLLVEKLNNGNYQLWKFKIKMILTRDELWGIVDKPVPVGKELTVAWTKSDKQAQAVIALAVDDDQLIHIVNAGSAREMWQILQKLHEQANFSSKLFLLRRLYKMRYQEGQQMQQHIKGMLEIVERLRGIGETIPDSNLAAILLCSLPDSYDTLITALEVRPSDELTLEFVRSKVIDEFNRRQESANSSDGAKAEVALNTINQGHKAGPKRETRVCFYCKKPGHLKKNCRRMKADQSKHTASDDSQKNKCAVGSSRTREFSAFMASNIPATETAWYVDSGATSHMTSNRNFFKIMKSWSENIHLADESTIQAEGVGNGVLKCFGPEGDIRNIAVHNVLYVPQLGGSLSSVHQLASTGHKLTFKENSSCINEGEEVVAVDRMDGSLYRLQIKTHEECLHLWHRWMGHRDPLAVKKLYTLANGIKLNNNQMMPTCNFCLKGKMSQVPFPTSTSRSTQPLELVHSDVCGRMKEATIGGNCYLVTFIDDYSRFTEIYLIKTKNDVQRVFQEYVAVYSNKFRRQPFAKRTDNGGEYMSKELELYLKKEGIKHELTVPYTPQQNGVTKRKNRSVIEMAKCMLVDDNLPNCLWGEAVHTATYLQNRLPSKAIEKTPYELWNGSKPKIAHIRVFGSRAFSYVPKEKRTKWND